MTAQSHDRPEARYFDLFFVAGIILAFFAFSGLALGVAITQGFHGAFKNAAAIALEALFNYSGLAWLLDTFTPHGFTNSFLGLKSWADLPSLDSLLPFVLGGSVIGLYFASKYFAKDHERMTSHIKHIAGPQILERDPGAKAVQSQIAEIFKIDGIKVHPKLQVSERLEVQHMLLAGSTGAGKTTILWQMIDQIVKRGDKLLLHDVKSDFTQKLASRVIIAPWDKRSWRWLIGKDITTEALAQGFAECFIVPNPKASDPVWDNAARALLRCEIHKLMAHSGTSWTFKDLGKGLMDDLLLGDDDPIKSMQNLQKLVRTYLPEAWQIVRDATSKATASVLFTQGGQLSALIDICRLDLELSKLGAKKFWLDQDQKGFLSDEIKTFPPVILKKCPDSTKWSSTFISAFVNVAALKINGLGDKDPDKRRIWFILDEVPQLGRIPEITTFLETGRSKGVRLVLGLQNAEQIDKIYGKEDRATWENNTVMKIWFQDVGPEAKKWASNSVGTRTVKVYSSTKTKGDFPSPGSSGSSNTYGEPKEQKLMEEHAFEMILKPRPKKLLVTGLMMISGFDRVVLDWPMLPRPIIDPLEKDPVVLPQRVIVDGSGLALGSSLFFESGPEKTTGEKKKEVVRELHIGTTTQELPIAKKPVQEKGSDDEKIDEEVEKIGEKILVGDPSDEAMNLLATLLDSGLSSAPPKIGAITVAKSETKVTMKEVEEEEEEDREC